MYNDLIVADAMKEIGNTYEKYVEEYYQRKRPYTPWCMIFVWYILKDYHPILKTASCTAFYNWVNKNHPNWVLPNIRLGVKSDIVVYNWLRNGKYQHIGIIDCRYNRDYCVIEGNTRLSQSLAYKVLNRIRTLTTYDKIIHITDCPYIIENTLITYGMSNNSVKWLQWQLNKCINANLDIDGCFGEETLKAVKTYQCIECLDIDGKVGILTIRSILEQGF